MAEKTEAVAQPRIKAVKLAANVFAPLNAVGDKAGAKAADGVVRLPEGFKAAFDAYGQGGWIGLNASPEHGGQGLPFALASAVQEQITSANANAAMPQRLSFELLGVW